jgi:hypothetical protein
MQRRESEIEALKAAVAAQQSDWSRKEKTKQEKELTLQEEGKKAAEKRMRMTRVKNIKELQALQREIEQIRQANTTGEEELIALMEQQDASATAIREKEQELAKAEEEWRARKAEIESHLIALEGELAEAAGLRQSIAGRIDGDLVGRYEMIFARRAGMAVVAVSEGICQGCYMNVPHQLINEILKGERLMTCPSCNRLLFYKPSDSTGKQL